MSEFVDRNSVEDGVDDLLIGLAGLDHPGDLGQLLIQAVYAGRVFSNP